MALVKDTCALCRDYRSQLRAYFEMYKRGDSSSIAGGITIINMMLSEQLDPEIEKILRSHPDACQTSDFCVYRRKELTELKTGLETLEKMLEGIDKDDRDGIIKLHNILYKLKCALE